MGSMQVEDAELEDVRAGIEAVDIDGKMGFCGSSGLRALSWTNMNNPLFLWGC